MKYYLKINIYHPLNPPSKKGEDYFHFRKIFFTFALSKRGKINPSLIVFQLIDDFYEFL